MKQLDELFSKVKGEINELEDLLYERMRELSQISKEKGINDFGWKDGMPDEEDEDEDEFDWDSFRDFQFSFITTDDFAYQTSEVLITRFKFDGNNLVGTEYYDDDDDELCTDAYVCFSYTDERNLRSLYLLICMVERELGVEE